MCIHAVDCMDRICDRHGEVTMSNLLYIVLGILLLLLGYIDWQDSKENFFDEEEDDNNGIERHNRDDAE